jgi:hypothetical protein
VSPVKYKLDFYIPEERILQKQILFYEKTFTNIERCSKG